MGQSESTRRCPKCGVELLESNMVQHDRECTKIQVTGKADGSWECTYAGPTSGIISLSKVIADVKTNALERNSS